MMKVGYGLRFSLQEGLELFCNKEIMSSINWLIINSDQGLLAQGLVSVEQCYACSIYKARIYVLNLSLPRLSLDVIIGK